MVIWGKEKTKRQQEREKIAMILYWHIFLVLHLLAFHHYSPPGAICRPSNLTVLKHHQLRPQNGPANHFRTQRWYPYIE